MTKKPLDTPIGHVSDGIEEYDNPLPRWWLYLFYFTIVFAIVYCVIYPSWWFWPGTQGWSQTAQYDRQVEDFQKAHPEGPKVDMEKVARDPSAVAAGQKVFEVRCVVCHGAHAEGKIGPSLIDKEWKYGGDPASVLLTIEDGRPGGMPPWKKAIGDKDCQNVAAYVLSLSQSAEKSN